MGVPNFTSPEDFAEYLEETLIPDLEANGSQATADDFKEAVYWIDQLNV